MKNIFKHFKNFAIFLLEDEALVEEMATVCLSLARENNVAFLKRDNQLPDDEIIKASKKGLREFLEQAVKDNVPEGTAPFLGLEKDKAAAFTQGTEAWLSYLVATYSLRKQLCLTFLPRYTQDVSLFSNIAVELEGYHLKVEQQAINDFTKVKADALKKENDPSDLFVGPTSWSEGDVQREISSEEAIEQQRLITAITEQVRQEQELKQPGDYYLTILDDFPSLIWKSNTEGLCDYFNNPWLEFTGRTYEQEYGNGWAEGVHPDDFDSCLDTYLSNFKAKTPFQMEYRMKRHDGSYRWIVDYGSPLWDLKGNFTGFLGACFDIQERKDFENKIQQANEKLSTALEELRSAQEQLLETNLNLESRVQARTEQLTASEKQLRLLTDALPTLISYVDKEETYRFVNKTYSVWFEKEKEEIEGKHIKEIVGEAVYNKMKPLMKDALAGKEVKVEGRMEYKYGRSRNVSTNLIPHFEDGEAKGFYALIYDTTEIKKAQQSLEAALADITYKNLELSRINNDLDNFIYAASHDLKSPIINMEGILTLLQKELSQKLNSKEQALFQLMETSVIKLKTTIGYLTDVTRISKNIEEAKEVLSIQKIVEEVKENNQQLIDEVSPLITENYEVETIEFVRGNFYSIVLNLFTNALKFRSPERPLHIQISTFTEENFLVLEVKDNGLGLSTDKQQNAFKLFKRMHSHVEGSGVGLYIIKRIAENSGGRATVEGIENTGATFRIFLPFSSRKIAAQTIDEHTPA